MNDKINKPTIASIAKPTPVNVIADKPKQTATTIVSEAAKKAASTTAAKPKAKATPKKKPAAQKTAPKAAPKKPAAKRAAPKKDNVVSINKNAVRNMLASTQDEAQKAQEQVMAFGIDSAEHFSRSADISAKLLNESVAISQENVEACVEASHIAAEHANDISESIINYTNEAIAESVDISKDFFECRTASDVFELQSKLFQSNTERFFNESSNIADKVFEMTSQASEPLSDRLADAADRLNKAMN